MIPGMTVIGPHTYRKSGMSYSRTRKNRPKNRAKPPIAKYAIGSRSRRLDVLEATLRLTKPRVLQSGVVRIRNARRMHSAGFRRHRALRSAQGLRDVLRLANEQHARTGDANQPEGDHRERDRPERLREGPAEDRSHDEPGPEDDRVNPERGPRHSMLDDVTEVRERGGRKRPRAGGEDDDQGPSGDELLEGGTAGPGGGGEGDRGPAGKREPPGPGRAAQPPPIRKTAPPPAGGGK